ncbi:protein SPT2 homolog [Anopheles marshallii]|uniref:protein SPT2 homolog n=1 Tax=Anopheles marshallii TaxID=1521116 RepID=UPI00237B29A7|nr:protein SPT2 homolog [Anopheles marshallii]
MDYHNILNIAKQNAESAKTSKGGRSQTTSATPTTKVTPEKKVLSENIKKFLAKKDEEERLAAAEKHLKAQELMAKRGGKGKKKIEKMLKVIKSANKSVLDDANDAQECALGTESLEDDYGYTSAVASQYYEKMMDKYKNIPAESMFSEAKKRCMSSEELARAKARVKNAIVKEQEEQHAPRSRKSRVSKADGGDDRISTGAVGAMTETKPPTKRDDPKQTKTGPNEERRVVRKPNVPPPPNFSTLLKIAETKQFEPIKVEVGAAKKRQDDRPLTSKERKEYEERKAFMEMKRLRDKIKQNESLSEEEKQRRLARLDVLRAAGKLPGIPPLPATSVSAKKPPTTVSSAGSTSNSRTVFKIPKRTDADPPKNVSNAEKQVVAKTAPLPTPEPKVKPSAGATKPTGSGIQKTTSTPAMVSSTTAVRTSTKQPTQTSGTTSMPQKSSVPSSTPLNGKTVSPAVQKSSVTNGKLGPAAGRPTGGTISTKPSSNGKQLPAVNQRSTAPTKRPPPELVTQTRQFPPPDVQRSIKRRDSGMPQTGGRPTHKKRRIIDSDSEYDSEMDDFIDDDDCEEDYSSAIKDIFGYDKSRYRDDCYDDDDDNMESSYAQQMREEYISKKIGLLEDLEDMRMEEEEKRRKLGKKKGSAPKKK